ncbi:nucleotidyltransferase domain-containing protein [Romboutsia sp.]|uniref:nucleotidyltransferase domain-containing protein n=1 Tax=Romboutsia sp. TaxID=1965302 RepID=UPI003F30330E
MPQNIQQEIDSIIEEINKVADINRIYLFGSYAYGNPDSNSDLDLCILTNDSNIRKRDLIKKIRKAISKTANIPVDTLVYEKNEFNDRAIVLSSMEHKIAYEGVSLYEQ